jgi:hypothetical protein
MFLLVASPWDTIGLVGATLITLGVAIGLSVLTRILAFRPSHKQHILTGQRQRALPGKPVQRALPAPPKEDRTDG